MARFVGVATAKEAHKRNRGQEDEMLEVSVGYYSHSSLEVELAGAKWEELELVAKSRSTIRRIVQAADRRASRGASPTKGSSSDPRGPT